MKLTLKHKETIDFASKDVHDKMLETQGLNRMIIDHLILSLSHLKSANIYIPSKRFVRTASLIELPKVKNKHIIDSVKRTKQPDVIVIDNDYFCFEVMAESIIVYHFSREHYWFGNVKFFKISSDGRYAIIDSYRSFLNKNNIPVSSIPFFLEKLSLGLKVFIFKHSAKIETHVLDAKQGKKKVKIGNEKIINETDIPITVLDSTWYTDLVVRGEFHVTGHFGLRAYGKGRTERKLVWIKPYKKGGYIRKAKKTDLA